MIYYNKVLVDDYNKLILPSTPVYPLQQSSQPATMVPPHRRPPPHPISVHVGGLVPPTRPIPAPPSAPHAVVSSTLQTPSKIAGSLSTDELHLR